MSTVTSARRTASGQVRFTVEDFGRMVNTGMFEGRHVELLDGEVYEVTKNPPHNFAVDALAEALRGVLSPDRYRVREEKPIGPWEGWAPEPDVAVVCGPRSRYGTRDPQPGDVLLLAEVCDTSEQDRVKKLAGYAAAGVPVYWILDLNLRRLESYTRPVGGSYESAVIIGEGELADVVVDGQVVGRIAVDELLPRRV